MAPPHQQREERKHFIGRPRTKTSICDDMAFAKDVQDAVFGAIQSLDNKAVDRGIKPDTMTKLGAVGVLNDVRPRQPSTRGHVPRGPR
jgi:hypothetical protein